MNAIQPIDALTNTLHSYLTPEQSNSVRRAYYFAEQAHHGQLRRSGEPYVTHPLAVAEELDSVLPNSRLEVARREDQPYEWPGVVREFIQSL